MDADRLWGWGRLFDDDGRFRVGRTVVNAVLHALIAFGAALVVCVPLALWAGQGLGACGWIGACAGTGAMVLREAIQWGVSGSPHLADRALDLAPAPLGGLIGGITAWLAVSRFLLS